ncbi:MAG: hypothetical protein KDD69_10435 [Bdellovibrionales bacterium]|nr:hypothetical protein [Bdellovibrionales bacterium]
MTATVLVFDPNAAVQAITAAALEQPGLLVEAHRDGAGAVDIIRRTMPIAVLIAHDLTNTDPYALCRALKKDPALKDISFVLLAPGDQKASIQGPARQAGIDALLFKPFKSDQVRRVVLPTFEAYQRASSTQSAASVDAPSRPVDPQAPLLIWLHDAFAARLLERVLERLGLQPRVLVGTETPETFSATAGAVFTDAADCTWFKPERHGKLVALGTASGAANSLLLPTPLSLDGIITTLGQFLDLSLPSPAAPNTPLNSAQQSLLAARITGRIYERLLTQEALRYRKWEEACSMVGAEALRICRSFTE